VVIFTTCGNFTTSGCRLSTKFQSLEYNEKGLTPKESESDSSGWEDDSEQEIHEARTNPVPERKISSSLEPKANGNSFFRKFDLKSELAQKLLKMKLRI